MEQSSGEFSVFAEYIPTNMPTAVSSFLKIEIAFTYIQYTILKCTTQWFSECSQGCKTITTIYFRIFSSTPNVTLCQSAVTPYPPLRTALDMTNLPYASIDLPLLDMRMNGIILCAASSDCRLSLSIMFSRFIHVVASIRVSFLFTAK